MELTPRLEAEEEESFLSSSQDSITGFLEIILKYGSERGFSTKCIAHILIQTILNAPSPIRSYNPNYLIVDCLLQSRAPTAYLAIYLEYTVVWESFFCWPEIFCQALHLEAKIKYI